MENGFNPLSAQCQVIIGRWSKRHRLPAKYLLREPSTVLRQRLGAAIVDADAIISMNHFKGHEQAGFGGSIEKI